MTRAVVDPLGVTALEFPEPALVDQRVQLRPWREADVTALVRAFDDPVMRRFSWRTAPYTDADALDQLREQEESRHCGETLSLAIVEPPDAHDVLGGVSLHQVHRREGRAAIGYWLAPAARGRGAATGAVRLLARWAFAELGLGRLELTCGPDNAASQQVADRCGFMREGVLRAHVPFQGGRRDSVVYGLLPGELRWPAVLRPAVACPAMTTDAAVAALLSSRGAGEIAHPGGTLSGHLARVERRLADLGLPRTVQLAGRTHAVYGTDGFDVTLLTLEERPVLSAIVGAEAEQLVYRYGACDRGRTWDALADTARVRDRFTGESEVLDPADLRSFADLSLVNELDVAEHAPGFLDRHGGYVRRLTEAWSRVLSPSVLADAHRVLG